MYLLDTNIISEIRKIKQNKANSGVELWYYQTHLQDIYINSIVLSELKEGELKSRHKNDFNKANAIENWINNYILIEFKDRILPITPEIGLICASLHIPNPREQHDALIAATALAHNFILVTHNQKHFSNIDGLRMIDPFS